MYFRNRATPAQKWWNRYGHTAGYLRWGDPNYDGIYPKEYRLTA